MFRLSRNFEYALIALKHLSSQGGKKVSTVKEISSCYEISYTLMARILFILKKAGVLTSVRGTNGGYALGKGLGKLSVYDLMKVVGDPPYLSMCLDKSGEKSKCSVPVKGCNIYPAIKGLQREVYNLTRGIKLKDIMAE